MPDAQDYVDLPTKDGMMLRVEFTEQGVRMELFWPEEGILAYNAGYGHLNLAREDANKLALVLIEREMKAAEVAERERIEKWFFGENVK